MPDKPLDIDMDRADSAKKLIYSTLSAWEVEGAAGVSVRTLAAAAGLPVSSIYYHFGDIEQLSESAQGAARALAAQWCEAQLEAIGRDVRGPAALGPLLAALIDDWCETRRTLAFARRECELMALRDPKHVASCAKWDTLWFDFWQEVCARLDIAEMATGTAWVFAATSGLHLLRWRRPIDRAALEELCSGWASWLDGRLAAPAPWYELARRDAAALMPPPAPDDAMAETISAAAAATVAKRGVAALTHRAVATEAGVTLGVVSYKFRTSAELLRAAFEAIYRRLAPQASGDPVAKWEPSREEALEQLRRVLAREDMLASEELMIASARNPTFVAFAAQLRYLRGRSARPYLQALLGRDRPIAPIDGAIYSAFQTGRYRAHLCSGRSLSADAPCSELSALLARLDRA